MWRDFGSIFVESGANVRKPGVVSWYDTIATEMQWKMKPICFRIASVQYGDKDFFVNDTFNDSLAFQGELLLQMSRPWQTRILDEINNWDTGRKSCQGRRQRCRYCLCKGSILRPDRPTV